MQFPWFIYALTAAVIWGVHYQLLSRAMTTISPISAYWLPTTIMVAGLPFMYKQLWTDFKATLAAGWDVQLSVGIIAFSSFAATWCLYKAIQSHNPVHASLIEITFPIFIAIFGILIFKENHLNIGTLIGGGMIMIGAGIVIYTNGV